MSNKAPNGKAPDNLVVPPLLIKAQYTKDLSFENPNILEILTTLKEAPQIALNVHVEARPLGDNDFEVLLTMNASAHVGEKKLFLVDLTYGGVFQVSPDVPQESVQPLVLIECPRLLFPFARSIIANITRDGGIPPVLVNPIDFVGLYHERIQQDSAHAQEGSQEK